MDGVLHNGDEKKFQLIGAINQASCDTFNMIHAIPSVTAVFNGRPLDEMVLTFGKRFYLMYYDVSDKIELRFLTMLQI